MRLVSVLLILLGLAAIAIAQETNFNVGPQYLITYGTALTLHPIATPSLSLGEAHPFVVDSSVAEALPATLPPASAPSDTFLGGVYWGEHKDTEIVARRLDTPSMTPSETAGYMNKVMNEVAGLPTAPAEEASETGTGPMTIELAGTPIPSALPESIFDAGVTGSTSAQLLAIRGYGVPLGEVAAYWKSHKRAAPHVFTNAEVVRPPE